MSKGDSGVSVNTTQGSDQTNNVASETVQVVKKALNGDIIAPQTEQATKLKTGETQAHIEKQGQLTENIPVLEVTPVEDEESLREDTQEATPIVSHVVEDGIVKADVVIVTRTEQTEQQETEQQTTSKTTVVEVTRTKKDDDLPIEKRRIDEIYETKATEITAPNAASASEKADPSSIPDVVRESQIKQSGIESVDSLIAVLQKPEINGKCNTSSKDEVIKPAVNGTANGKLNGTPNGVVRDINSNAVRKPVKGRQQMQVEKRYFRFGAIFIVAVLAIGVYIIIGNGPMNIMTRTFRK